MFENAASGVYYPTHSTQYNQLNQYPHQGQNFLPQWESNIPSERKPIHMEPKLLLLE